MSADITYFFTVNNAGIQTVKESLNMVYCKCKYMFYRKDF